MASSAARISRVCLSGMAGGLCLGGILSPAGQRRYVAMITAAALAGLAAGMVARLDASKFMITYAIQALRAAPTEPTKSALPPPAGMVAELKAFHKFQADKGFDYVVAAPALENFADDLAHATRSPFVVYEDDRPLGPAHARHADISTLGHGRFSHWKDLGFLISSSDGTNPRTNGRNYWVVLPENHAPVPGPVAAPEPGPPKAAEVGPTKASEAAIPQPVQAAPPAEIIAQNCKFTNDFNSIDIRKTL